MRSNSEYVPSPELLIAGMDGVGKTCFFIHCQLLALGGCISPESTFRLVNGILQGCTRNETAVGDDHEAIPSVSNERLPADVANKPLNMDTVIKTWIPSKQAQFFDHKSYCFVDLSPLRTTWIGHFEHSVKVLVFICALDSYSRPGITRDTELQEALQIWKDLCEAPYFDASLVKFVLVFSKSDLLSESLAALPFHGKVYNVKNLESSSSASDVTKSIISLFTQVFTATSRPTSTLTILPNYVGVSLDSGKASALVVFRLIGIDC